MPKKILRLMIKISFNAISFLVYFGSGFCHRNKNIIIFGCWEGMHFRGNSKYLYLYFKENYPEIQSVWVTKDYSLNIKLRSKGINSYYAKSLQGIIYSLKAKYFVVTHGIRDVNEYLSRKGTLINLEHTIYPIKSLALNPPSEKITHKIYKYLVNPYGYLIRPDYAITSSEYTSRSTLSHFKINPNRIIPLGTPKSDIMYLNSKDSNNTFKNQDYQIYYKSKKKRILFMPTWRQNKDFSIFDENYNYKKLDNLLHSTNAKLGINFHPTTLNKNINVNLFDCDNIEIFNSIEDEMNNLLSGTDILITDYSSIFADFLIFNRPLIFAKFDHESYIREIDLFLDYDKELPGKIVTNWYDLSDALSDVLIHNKDEYKIMRTQMFNKIYANLDGNARARIANFIISSL